MPLIKRCNGLYSLALPAIILKMTWTHHPVTCAHTVTACNEIALHKVQICLNPTVARGLLKLLVNQPHITVLHHCSNASMQNPWPCMPIIIGWIAFTTQSLPTMMNPSFRYSSNVCHLPLQMLQLLPPLQPKPSPVPGAPSLHLGAPKSQCMINMPTKLQCLLYGAHARSHLLPHLLVMPMPMLPLDQLLTMNQHP